MNRKKQIIIVWAVLSIPSILLLGLFAFVSMDEYLRTLPLYPMPLMMGLGFLAVPVFITLDIIEQEKVN